MTRLLDTLLLLALPASGKSEVRRFLDSRTPAERREEFFMGPTVQLDDYPYVHLMRRFDDEAARLEVPAQFYEGADRPFRDPRDWLTLVELVNEDYEALHRPAPAPVADASRHVFDRIEAAAERAGIPPRIHALQPGRLDRVLRALDRDCRQALDDQVANLPPSLEGRTIVIEFSRGGPAGATLPLPDPLGYRGSLARLSPAILERASILYLEVLPEQARRKNVQRADPDNPGSILHHGVPAEVMSRDYGCDDFGWLLARSSHPGAVDVVRGDRVFRVPAASLDNREDRTTFVRSPRQAWTDGQVAALRDALHGALASLAAAR